MYWREVSKCDRFAAAFAAPHYSIAKPLAAELGPPGQKIVLMGEEAKPFGEATGLRLGRKQSEWTDSRVTAALFSATTEGRNLRASFGRQ